MKWLLLACFFPAVLLAQTNIGFRDISLPQALKQSSLEQKPVFLWAFASWCPHCNKMKEEVFTNAAVAGFYNSHFICIKQDMEKGEGIALHSRFNITSYPTFIFLDAAGTTIYRVTGEFNVHSFITNGTNAGIKEKQLPYLAQQFESDTADVDKSYAYLLALKAAGIDFKVMVKRYLSTKTDEQLLNEKNWKILTNGITDIESPYFQFIVNHQADYADLTSANRVQRKLFFTVKQQMEELPSGDTTNYSRLRKVASSIHNNPIDSLLFALDLARYEHIKDWVAYKAASLEGTTKYAWNDAAQLSEIADVYVKNIADKAALAQAAIWAKRAIELNGSYACYITAAKLFQKAGDNPSALQITQEAKEVAVKYGWNYKEAEDLLQQLQKK